MDSCLIWIVEHSQISPNPLKISDALNKLSDAGFIMTREQLLAILNVVYSEELKTIDDTININFSRKFINRVMSLESKEGIYKKINVKEEIKKHKNKSFTVIPINKYKIAIDNGKSQEVYLGLRPKSLKKFKAELKRLERLNGAS